jgi:hypothetical protein
MYREIRVIYPSGDKTKLAFGIMYDYESSEWSIAGRQSFPDTVEGEKQALEYGRHLAESHGLPLDCSNLSDGHDFLD